MSFYISASDRFYASDSAASVVKLGQKVPVFPVSWPKKLETGNFLLIFFITIKSHIASTGGAISSLLEVASKNVIQHSIKTLETQVFIRDERNQKQEFFVESFSMQDTGAVPFTVRQYFVNLASEIRIDVLELP